MSWFHRRKSVNETKSPSVETDGQKAIERARTGKREAETDLAEMAARANRIKDQRVANHFAPLIWEAMKSKDDK